MIKTVSLVLLFIALCFAQNSFVRVFHASPNTPPVDVYVDGTRLVTNLGYKAYSLNYVSLTSGSHNIKVWPTGATSGQGTPAINQDLTIGDNKFYTVFVVGLLSGTGKQVVQTLMYEDQPGVASSTRIRAIQLSPNASPVNMVLQNNQSALLIGNITYQEATAIYLPLPGGFYALDFRPVNNLTIVAVSAPNATYSAGTAYTVVLVGLAGDNASPPLETVRTVDGVAPGTTAPGTTAPGTTNQATTQPASTTTIPSLTNGATGSAAVLLAVLAAAFFLLAL